MIGTIVGLALTALFWYLGNKFGEDPKTEEDSIDANAW